MSKWTQCWPTGSSYIGADPDKGAQDIDFLRFVHKEDREELVEEMTRDGWELCGLGYTKAEEDNWEAYRRGDYNVILCWCPLVYMRWVAFTELARRCCFIEKTERIELCKAILEGDEEAAMNIVHLSGFNTIAGNLMEGYINDDC